MARRSADRLPGIMADREGQDGMGRDLWALVESRGIRLQDATQLSGTPGASRATFRLEFADGRILKGRRCQTSGQAAQIERLGRLLDPRYFPRVLARQGPALLTEWVAGRPLMPGDITVARLRACGTILAEVHRTPIADQERAAASSSILAWRRTLMDGLVALTRCGALRPGEQEAAAALAARSTPPHPTLCLTHGDFCEQNIVLDQRAELHVVDNENLGVQPVEYDLARTWYLWPMKTAERTAFVGGYALDEPLARFTAHFDFWTTLVLVESARFRLRHRTADPSVPLRRLRSLIPRAPSSFRTLEGLGGRFHSSFTHNPG